MGGGGKNRRSNTAATTDEDAPPHNRNHRHRSRRHHRRSRNPADDDDNTSSASCSRCAPPPIHYPLLRHRHSAALPPPPASPPLRTATSQRLCTLLLPSLLSDDAALPSSAVANDHASSSTATTPATFSEREECRTSVALAAPTPRVGSACHPLLVFGRYIMAGTTDGRVCIYDVHIFDDVDDDDRSDDDRREKKEDEYHNRIITKREKLRQQSAAMDGVCPVCVVPLGREWEDLEEGLEGRGEARREVNIVEMAATPSGTSLVRYCLVDANGQTSTDKGTSKVMGTEDNGRSCDAFPSDEIFPPDLLGHVAALTAEGDVFVLEVLLPREETSEDDRGETVDAIPARPSREEAQRTRNGESGTSGNNKPRVSVVHSFHTGEVGATCLCLHEVPPEVAENREGGKRRRSEIRICVGYESGCVADFEVAANVVTVWHEEDIGIGIIGGGSPGCGFDKDLVPEDSTEIKMQTAEIEKDSEHIAVKQEASVIDIHGNKEDGDEQPSTGVVLETQKEVVTTACDRDGTHDAALSPKEKSSALHPSAIREDGQLPPTEAPATPKSNEEGRKRVAAKPEPTGTEVESAPSPYQIPPSTHVETAHVPPASGDGASTCNTGSNECPFPPPTATSACSSASVPSGLNSPPVSDMGSQTRSSLGCSSGDGGIIGPANTASPRRQTRRRKTYGRTSTPRSELKWRGYMDGGPIRSLSSLGWANGVVGEMDEEEETELLHNEQKEATGLVEDDDANAAVSALAKSVDSGRDGAVSLEEADMSSAGHSCDDSTGDAMKAGWDGSPNVRQTPDLPIQPTQRSDSENLRRRDRVDAMVRRSFLAVGLDPQEEASVVGPESPASSTAPPTSSCLEVVNASAVEREWSDYLRQRKVGAMTNEHQGGRRNEEQEEEFLAVDLDVHCVWPEVGMELVDGWTWRDAVRREESEGAERSGWDGVMAGRRACENICALQGSDPPFAVAMADGTVAVSHSFVRYDRDIGDDGDTGSNDRDCSLSWGVAHPNNQLLLAHPCIGMGQFIDSISSRQHVACCLRGGTVYVIPVAPRGGDTKHAHRNQGAATAQSLSLGFPLDGAVTVYQCPFDSDGENDGLVRYVQGFAAGHVQVSMWMDKDGGSRHSNRGCTDVQRKVLPVLVYSWAGGFIDVYSCGLLPSRGMSTALDNAREHKNCTSGSLIEALIKNGTAKVLMDLLLSMEEGEAQVKGDVWTGAWRECQKGVTKEALRDKLFLDEGLDMNDGLCHFRSLLLGFSHG